MKKIIGICLIKNEEFWIEQVLKNILNFCDEVIVLDNLSKDATFEIVKKISKKMQKVKLFRIKDVLRSHKFVEKYANTQTWIFGVDGDEIYDPIGLERLRKEILGGKYDEYWQIKGNYLHCEEINLRSKLAYGYLSPPAKSVSKLYNFSVIESWKEKNSERLHGENIKFKNGFNRKVYEFYKIYDWENSYFRCLHLCFMKRSSLDKNWKARLAPSRAFSCKAFVKNFLMNLKKGRFSFSDWYKLEKYKRGKKVKKNISAFFI